MSYANYQTAPPTLVLVEHEYDKSHPKRRNRHDSLCRFVLGGSQATFRTAVGRQPSPRCALLYAGRLLFGERIQGGSRIPPNRSKFKMAQLTQLNSPEATMCGAMFVSRSSANRLCRRVIAYACRASLPLPAEGRHCTPTPGIAIWVTNMILRSAFQKIGGPARVEWEPPEDHPVPA